MPVPDRELNALLDAIDVLEGEWKRVVARDDHLSVSAMRVGVRGVLRARDLVRAAEAPMRDAGGGG